MNTNRTIRLLVSSTFSDLKAEPFDWFDHAHHRFAQDKRDALQRKVFCDSGGNQICHTVASLNNLKKENHHG